MIETEIDKLPETGFLRLPTVLKYIPVSKTTWWNGVKSGRFPKSVKLGKGLTVWRAEDIKDYINNHQ
jgi:predicted DNA-binding transcriptional regulator AlpA